MNCTFIQILICIFAAPGFLPVAHSVKGKFRVPAIFKAIRQLKYYDTAWEDSSMELLSESIGLHLSTIPTFPIDTTKVVVGVVSKNHRGIKTLIALLCRLAKGRPVAIWEVREQTPEDYEALLRKIGCSTKTIPLKVAEMMEKPKESPMRKKFDALLELLTRNGATVYKESGNKEADNAFFQKMEIAFAYDGYRDDGSTDSEIGPDSYGALNALKYLKEEKKAVLWALKATGFHSVYIKKDHPDNKMVTVADHCTTFNYYSTSTRGIEENQHLVIPAAVHEAIEKMGEECTWEHDVFIISYSGGELITEEHLQHFDKFKGILDSFQVHPPTPLQFAQ